jgi:cell division protein FtsB
MLAKKGKNKKTIKTLFFSAVFILLFLAVAGFLVFSNWKVNQKRSELNAKIISLKKEIQEMEDKKTQLEDALQQTQSSDYAEKVAREDLNMKKQDEDVVAVKQSTGTAETAAPAEKSFWKKIIDKFNF